MLYNSQLMTRSEKQTQDSKNGDWNSISIGDTKQQYKLIDGSKWLLILYYYSDKPLFNSSWFMNPSRLKKRESNKILCMWFNDQGLNVQPYSLFITALKKAWDSGKISIDPKSVFPWNRFWAIGIVFEKTLLCQ